MCASIGVTGDPRSANCPRRRPIAVPHSRRLCAAAGSRSPPLLDARKSVPSTARANMCASIRVTGDPKVGKLHCLRRRAIALPHSRRLCAAAASLPPPLLDARKSVPSTARANMCASIRVTGDPRSANCTVCAVAPSLSHTRFDCARPRAQSPQPLLDGRKSNASTTGTTMCASIGATRDPRSPETQGPAHCLPLPRKCSPTLASAARAHGHSHRISGSPSRHA
jgi:hypothetical protein